MNPSILHSACTIVGIDVNLRLSAYGSTLSSIAFLSKASNINGVIGKKHSLKLGQWWCHLQLSNRVITALQEQPPEEQPRVQGTRPGEPCSEVCDTRQSAPEACLAATGVRPELCPPQRRYVGVLIPRTSKCDCIWIKGLYRGDQVKMRSLGWAPLQHDCCHDKRGKLGPRGQTLWRHRLKTAIYKPRRKEQSSSSPSEGTNPADTLISNFWPPELCGHTFLLFKPQVCGLCCGSPNGPARVISSLPREIPPLPSPPPQPEPWLLTLQVLPVTESTPAAVFGSRGQKFCKLWKNGEISDRRSWDFLSGHI